MEVISKESLIAITIEATPEEFEELDRELNRFYEIVTTYGNEQFCKIWELKDKLNIAVKG